MNKNLSMRLAECNITLEEIQTATTLSLDDYCLFLYSSHIENLGTQNSDFDIYIICNDIPNNKHLINRDNYKVRQIFINNVLFDIEYWTFSSLLTLIDKINSSNFIFNSDQLKFLHRLSMAECMGNLEKGIIIKKSIKDSHLLSHVKEYYRLQATSFLEDAVYMYTAGYFTCAASCAYKALDNAIGLLNAHNGKTNLKGKWISKIFLDDNSQPNELKKRYLSLQFYAATNPENMESFLEDKIDFIQDILAKSSFDKF